MAGHRIGRQHSLASSCGQGALLVLAALTTGCKSGSWGAKPSWWSFGGTAPSSSLAAAPEFDKQVTKPSEAAKPYPTTSTPEGYSLAGGEQPAAAPGGRPTLEPTSITYGATPPAEAQPQTMAQQPAQPVSPASAQAGVGPQVGPYASLQPAPSSAAVDPAAAATAGLAAAPAFGEATPPAAAPRVADARGSDAWAAAPPAADGDPRYGASTGSRFSGSFQPAGIEPPPMTAPAAPMEAPPASPVAPAFSAPAAVPPATSLDPSPAGVTPPPAGGDSLPGSLAPPRRRPDPGYRPGGTSSYRPSRSILAEDEAAPGGVLPASFEASLPVRQ